MCPFCSGVLTQMYSRTILVALPILARDWCTGRCCQLSRSSRTQTWLLPSLFTAIMVREATGQNKRQILPGVYNNYIETAAPTVHTASHVEHVRLPRLVLSPWPHGFPAGPYYLILGASRLVPTHQSEYASYCLAADPTVQLSGDLGGHASRTVCRSFGGEFLNRLQLGPDSAPQSLGV